MPNTSAPQNHPSLVALLHALVLKAPSGLDAHTISNLLDKNYNTLMSELLRQERHKLSADLVLPLMALLGSDEPMHFLARQMGGVFYRLEQPTEEGTAFVRGLADSIKEFSKFATCAAQSIEDGKIERHELDALVRKVHKTIAAILSLSQLAADTHEAQFGGQ